MRHKHIFSGHATMETMLIFTTHYHSSAYLQAKIFWWKKNEVYESQQIKIPQQELNKCELIFFDLEFETCISYRITQALFCSINRSVILEG